jgi:predicted MFS family arabinose efflux permease
MIATAPAGPLGPPGLHTLRERFRRWAESAPRGGFWIYFSAAIFFNLGFSIFVFLFNLYLLSLGLTERSLGVIGSCAAVGGILGTLPAGVLAQRFGLRATLTGGILLAVVCSVLRTSILWQPAQLALAALTGCTLCCWAVCLSPTVAGLTTERQRPLGFSLMFASGIGIGGLAGLLAGRLPQALRELPLRSPLSLVHAERATLLLACAIAALALLPLSRLSLPVPPAPARAAFFTNPFLRRFLPAIAVWGLVTGSFAPFANVYFVHHLGLSLRSLGSVFSLAQLATFAAVLGAPLFFRRTGLTRGIMLTQLATAAALAALAAVHTAALAACVYWIYMAVQCMNEPGIYSLLMDRVPSAERNRASASTFFVSSGSAAVASAATGAAIVRFGYSYVLAAIATLAVAAAFLFQRLLRTSRSSAAPTA